MCQPFYQASRKLRSLDMERGGGAGEGDLFGGPTCESAEDLALVTFERPQQRLVDRVRSLETCRNGTRDKDDGMENTG